MTAVTAHNAASKPWRASVAAAALLMLCLCLAQFSITNRPKAPLGDRLQIPSWGISFELPRGFDELSAQKLHCAIKIQFISPQGLESTAHLGIFCMFAMSDEDSATALCRNIFRQFAPNSYQMPKPVKFLHKGKEAARITDPRAGVAVRSIDTGNDSRYVFVLRVMGKRSEGPKLHLLDEVWDSIEFD